MNGSATRFLLMTKMSLEEQAHKLLVELQELKSNSVLPGDVFEQAVRLLVDAGLVDKTYWEPR